MNFSIQSVYNWYRNLLRNPKYRWWVIIGTVVYLLSPIDIAPDFIPIAGQIDDFLVLSLLVSEVSGLVLESWKAKQDHVETANNNTTQSGTEKTDAIDVDAVSVK